MTLADVPEEAPIEVGPDDMLVDLHVPSEVTEEEDAEHVAYAVHIQEEEAETQEVPELVDNNDEDSDSKSVDSLGEEGKWEELEELLNAESDEDERAEQMMKPRSTAGQRKYDDRYKWSLMNFSMGEAIWKFGDVAS